MIKVGTTIAHIVNEDLSSNATLKNNKLYWEM